MKDMKSYRNKHYYSIIKNYNRKETDVVIISNLTSLSACNKAYKALKEKGIMEIACSGNSIAVTKEGGSIASCCDTFCVECLFCGGNCKGGKSKR